MKKAVALVFAICLLSISSQAQNYRSSHLNEVTLSYGFSALSALIDLINDAGLVNGEPGDNEYMAIKSGGSKGVLNLGYTRQVNPYVSVGSQVSYNRLSLDFINGEKVSSYGNADVLALMAVSKFDWFHTNSGIFNMYSRLGLGAMYVHGDLLKGLLNGHVFLPTAHVTFIGMEVGKDIFGFLELGAGFQGFAQVGVKARL